MAKQTVSGIERHLEKGVLGIAGGVFVAMLALYVVQSPNSVEFDGQPVTPPEIDRKVLDAAKGLQRDIQVAVHEGAKIDDPLPEFERVNDVVKASKLPAELIAPVSWGVRVPDILEQSRDAQTAVLAGVVTPPPPKLTGGRSVIAFVPAALGGDPITTTSPEIKSVNWVNVATLFDRGRQMESNMAAGQKSVEPYFVGLDVERQRLLPNGDWGEWEPVTPYTAYEPPVAPEVQLQPDGTLGEDFSKALAYTKQISDVQNQVDLMRPVLYGVKSGDPWLFPKFSGIDLVLADNAFYGGRKVNRYPPQIDPAEEEKKEKEKEKEPKSAVGKAKKLLADVKTEIQTAGADVEKLTTARASLDKAIASVKELFADAGGQAKQLKPFNELSESLDDTVALAQKRAANPAAAPVVSAAEVKIDPVQVVWALDALENSVQPGRTYQYRVRLRILNRYAGFPGELKNKEDATKFVLLSEWSPASEPIEIEPEVRFFLTSASAGKGQTVEVYKWYNGVWLDADAKVEIGKPISAQERNDVPDPLGGGVTKEMIEFETGATVVDLDLERPHHRRNDKGAAGFNIDETVGKTVALVYRDADGILHERLFDLDRNNKEAKELKKRTLAKVSKPPEPPAGEPGPGAPGPRGAGRPAPAGPSSGAGGGKGGGRP